HLRLATRGDGAAREFEVVLGPVIVAGTIFRWRRDSVESHQADQPGVTHFQQAGGGGRFERGQLMPRGGPLLWWKIRTPTLPRQQTSPKSDARAGPLQWEKTY